MDHRLLPMNPLAWAAETQIEGHRPFRSKRIKQKKHYGKRCTGTWCTNENSKWFCGICFCLMVINLKYPSYTCQIVIMKWPVNMQGNQPWNIWTCLHQQNCLLLNPLAQNEKSESMTGTTLYNKSQVQKLYSIPHHNCDLYTTTTERNIWLLTSLHNH